MSQRRVFRFLCIRTLWMGSQARRPSKNSHLTCAFVKRRNIPCRQRAQRGGNVETKNRKEERSRSPLKQRTRPPKGRFLSNSTFSFRYNNECTMASRRPSGYATERLPRFLSRVA